MEKISFIPARVRNAAKGGHVAGAVDILDDNIGRDQQEINANTYRKTEVYNKTEIGNLLNRTPETDVVVLDVPSGGTALDALNAVDEADRDNKLFRVRNDNNTRYDEYGWTGTAWALLASKDYGIDDEVTAGSDNFVKSNAVARELALINPNHNIIPVKGILMLGDYGSIASDEDSMTLVISLNGDETVTLGKSKSTTYYCFTKSYNKATNEFTRVDWLDNDRSSVNLDDIVTINLADGVHDGAKFLMVTTRLQGKTRPISIFDINGIDYNSDRSIYERVVALEDDKVDKDVFNLIVGEGHKEDIEFPEPTQQSSFPKRTIKNRFVQKGDVVNYSIYSYAGSSYSETAKIYFMAATVKYSTFYDEDYDERIIAVGKHLTADLGKLIVYEGSFTAPVDCYVSFRGIVPSEDHPERNSKVTVYSTLTSIIDKTAAFSKGYVKTFNLRHLGNKVTVDGVQVTMPKVILTTDEIDRYLGFASIVQASPGLFYMYYDSMKNPINGITVKGQGLSFAYSRDGFNWIKGFPDGRDAPNVVFPLIESEENGNTVYLMPSYTGISVVKVNDAEYPFRMFGNEAEHGTTATIADYKGLFMWKSADGINFVDKKEVSSLKYDTQYSVIPYGDVLKIYCRMRDGAVRNIGVMFVDLEGNIITPATTLFGDYMYTSSAFKIDNRRELLMPIMWTPDDDLCTYTSFIVDGEKVTESTDIDDILKVKGEAPQWNADGVNLDGCFGMVCTGLILIDGDCYIAYCQRNYSHDRHSSNPASADRCVEIRLVQLVWNKVGTTPK